MINYLKNYTFIFKDLEGNTLPSFVLEVDLKNTLSFSNFINERIIAEAVNNAPPAAISLQIDSGVYLTSDGKSVITSYESLPSDTSQPIYIRPIKLAPGPAPLPFVGNAYDLIPDTLVGFNKLYATYGNVIKLNLQGNEMIGSNDTDIVELFSKESDFFTKKIVGPMQYIKQLGGKGLFTTDTDDADWTLAHLLLMPAFSPKAMKAYTEEMGQIGLKISKIFASYANEPSRDDQIMDITEWMTNVTFETIGRVGFGYDFGLLEKRGAPIHPFIRAMGFCLSESGARSIRPQLISTLSFSHNRRFNRDLKLMQDTVDEVIQARKNSPDAKNSEKDLLGFMLNAREELTDKSLTDE
ncbi:hypothetical protein HK096_010729, partial [Nowakowskiella sp. JEL0078]